MQRSAIGIRVHSGWGALVTVTGKGADIEVIDRRRVEIIDSRKPGTAQPFHFAERLEISKAQDHVACCAAASKTLALAALQEVARHLKSRSYEVSGVVILLSSGRPLPGFEKILSAHALIHAAEGEFFRQAFRDAAEELKIPVTGIRERELDAEMKSVMGKAAPGLHKKVADLGRVLGPPWTADQKSAALAAALVLASRKLHPGQSLTSQSERRTAHSQ
jgi:hypothetical protein